MGTTNRNLYADALRNDSISQIVNDMDFQEHNTNLDPYAVIVAGGHVGFSKCRPILSVVYAKNKKQAAYMASFMPRAKGDQKYSVLACEQLCKNGDPVGKLQVWLIDAINDYDPYMFSNNNGYDSEHKNLTTNLSLENAVRRFYKHNGSKKYEEELDNVRTILDFEDDDVIQRHCAPKIEHGVPVPTKRVNMHVLLHEFFTAKVKKIAMRPLKHNQEVRAILQISEDLRTSKQKKYVNNLAREKYRRANMLMIYYKLFGKNNPLNIKMTPEYIEEANGKIKKVFNISYPGEGDFDISFVAPERLVEVIGIEQETEPIFAEKSALVDDAPRTEEERRASGKRQIEKFYAKYGGPTERGE